ncbi:MAG: efflux RND transporter periplasmic adaptor subunit [Bacteroidia bacterium]
MIIFLGILLKNYFASKKEEPKKMLPSSAERIVKVKPVFYSEIQSGIIAFGRVNTAQSVSLIAEVGGRLLQGTIPLKEATVFNKGDIIYRIDDREARFNLQSQKSEFLNNVASALADIKIDFPDELLKWENFLQQIEINKSLPELPEIKSRKEKTFISNRKLLTQYYTIKSAEERLAKYTFIAPYKGSIAQLNFEEGSIVNPGANIGRIIRTDEMEAEIPVKSENIKWIEIGMPVKLFADNKSMSWDGKIVRISDYVDPNTQSIMVYVKLLPNAQFKLYEGIYLQAEIEGKKLVNTMEIPRKALVNNNQVYVVESNKLKLKPITIHKVNPNSILFSGLEEGELVVVESIVNMAENTTVKTQVED